MRRALKGVYLPLDGETGHTGLLSKHIALDSVDQGLSRRLCVELWRVIFVVHIVSDADKLAAVVGAGQENDRDSNNVGIGDS